MKTNYETSKKKSKVSIKYINQLIGFVASIVTILGFSAIAFLTPIIDKVPFVSEMKIEKKIESIRIGFDREYIEEIIGRPNASDSLQYFDSDNEETIDIAVKEYFNNLYVGKFYYKDNERLISYIITSRKKSFNPLLPQKDNGMRLVSSNMDKVNMVYCKTAGFSSRSDNSSYYLEFEHPWLGDDYLLYGFAYSDIGYSTPKSGDAIVKLIHIRDTSFEKEGKNYLSKIDSRNETKDVIDSVKKLKEELPINTVIVIDEEYVDTFQFLDEIGKFGLGYNRLDINRIE